MDDENLLGSYTIMTDAGMCALWQPEHFAHVGDDEWADVLGTDAAMESCIEAGVFVPLNIGSDGVYRVVLRTGERTAREKRYTQLSSEPYLLVSKGVVALSGVEYILGQEEAEKIDLAPGRYTVTVHWIEWEAEPGSVDARGKVTGSALPDFVVEITPERRPAPTYRKNVNTFDWDEWVRRILRDKK